MIQRLFPSTFGRSHSHPATSSVSAYEEALQLWLRWDEQNRGLTERMFQKRDNRLELERLMDECDNLRKQAAKISRQLLGN